MSITKKKKYQESKNIITIRRSVTDLWAFYCNFKDVVFFHKIDSLFYGNFRNIVMRKNYLKKLS